ncbi:PAS domain-containing sensor histidine kinase [Leptospira ilyithenensis]|uniref:histidine kinase n=1 Tax=Leptospira ilyithenensis TaxID=2484901 RepID=A0A4R9LUD0_9LEPT|nr:PAS domain S-box protein [Leptospira ilyithenensis]TGN14495.1 PAS domain S-box protein [Leptospira ilyithenensis]
MLNEPGFAQTILDTVASLILVLDTEGRIRVFNRRCQEKTGYSFEEVENQYIWDILILESERSLIRSKFKKIQPGRDNVPQFQNVWLTKSGDQIMIRWNNAFLTDKEGKLEYILGTGVDITEEVLAKEALETQSIFEGYLNSFSRKLNFASYEDVPKILKVSLSEMANRMGARFASILDLSFPMISWEEIKKTDYSFYTDWMFKNPQEFQLENFLVQEIFDRITNNKVVLVLKGKIIEVGLSDQGINWIFVPVKNSNQVLCFYSDRFNFSPNQFVPHLRLFCDLFGNGLDRIAFDHRLREERDFLNKVLAISADGIAILNPDGRIIYANRSSEKILGLERNEGNIIKYKLPKFHYKTLEGNPFPEENQPFAVILRTREPVENIIQIISWEGENEKTISITGAPILKESGEIEMVVFFISDISFKLIQEKKLKESEARLRLAVDVAKIGIWEWDILNDRFLGSERLYELYFVSKDGFPNFESFRDLVHPEDKNTFNNVVQQVLSESGGAVYLQYRFIDHTKKIHWMEGYIQVSEVENQSARMIGVVRDISSRMNFERELKESESRFQAFYQITTEAIWISDSNFSGIVDANPAFFSRFGYRENELESIDISSLFARESWDLILDEGFAENTSVNLFACEKDGTLFPVSVKTRIIHDKGVVRTAVSMQDLTFHKVIDELRTYNGEILRKNDLIEKQKQDLVDAMKKLQLAQAQLVQSEKMAALGHLIAGIAHEINNPIGAIQASNQNLRNAQMGFPERIRALKEIYSVIDYDTLDDMMNLLFDSYNTSNFISGLEARNKRKVLVQTLKEKSIEDAESIADSAIDLGIHEVILKYIKLLQHPHSSEILEIIFRQIQSLNMSKTIQVAVDRASKIIYALKNYSHFDQEGVPIPGNITEGINTVLTIYQDKIRRGVEVIRNFESSPSIYCYPDDLLHVWTNIIFNALQAMKFKGSLVIRTFCSNNHLVVSIMDTGPGIPEEHRDKIFEPFFTTKAPGEGSGLGLDIVKRVIERHKGEIKIDSEPGRTEFRIYLPMDLHLREK